MRLIFVICFLLCFPILCNIIGFDLAGKSKDVASLFFIMAISATVYDFLYYLIAKNKG